VLPLLLGAVLPHPIAVAVREAALLATLTLLVSHLLVRILKDLATRPRPSLASPHCRLIDTPGCFSFPSGHAAAAAALAAGYGVSAPGLAPALALIALVVGASRVRLGVHYPGDVLAGQAIAVLTALALTTVATPG
jgi:undecaprenyl-diphosphatase